MDQPKVELQPRRINSIALVTNHNEMRSKVFHELVIGLGHCMLYYLGNLV